MVADHLAVHGERLGEFTATITRNIIIPGARTPPDRQVANMTSTIATPTKAMAASRLRPAHQNHHSHGREIERRRHQRQPSVSDFDIKKRATGCYFNKSHLLSLDISNTDMSSLS
jgi:hypothetical protein